MIQATIPPNTPRRAFIGDVHGCFEELSTLLKKIGFDPESATSGNDVDEIWFVGDLVNGGPRADAVLALVERMVREGRGGFVLGNHDDNLLRALEDGDRPVDERTRESLRQIDEGGDISRRQALALLKQAPLESHFGDSGILLVHAAPVSLAGNPDERRATAIYGPTADGKDARGKALRVNWTRGYADQAFVVFGHSPHRAPARFGPAICIDTGCVYNGMLTAYLAHEDRCVSVRANRAYREGYLRPHASEGPYI